MKSLLPTARLVAPWMQRVRAWFQDRTHENCIAREEVERRVVAALTAQLFDLYDHVHDRDMHISVLQAQVRELGAEPHAFKVIRKPLPTFSPGPGMKVSR